METQDRLEAVEDELGMDNALSASLPKPHMDRRKMSDMWAEAGRVTALKAIDDDLTEWSDAATEQNRRGYETARTFYRGTSIEEALDITRRGGISKDGRFDFTSLSTSLGAALTFGRKNKIQVVLEYDGDSIRRTGEAVSVEYSHKHSSLDRGGGGCR